MVSFKQKKLITRHDVPMRAVGSAIKKKGHEENTTEKDFRVIILQKISRSLQQVHRN